MLGKRRSLILCLALIISTFPFVFLLILEGLIPFELLYLTPLTYFIIAPIVKKDDKYVIFYAKQSLIVFLVYVIAAVVIIIPVIGWIKNY